MLNKIKEKMLYGYVSFRSFLADKKGLEMLEWVAMAAFIVGVIVIATPSLRNSVLSFLSNVFSRLTKMSAGQ